MKIWPVPVMTASIFSKIREFLWYHLKVWTATIITSWNFCKNIPFLMKPFEHLNCPVIMRYNSIKCKTVLMMSLPLTPLTCPYYHKVKFSLKYDSFNVTWKIHLPLLSPYCPYYEICTKNKTIIRDSYENLTCL